MSCVSPNTAQPPCCQLAEAVALSRPPFTVKAVSLITAQLQCSATGGQSPETAESSGLLSTASGGARYCAVMVWADRVC
jgi:hypothetical protein